MRCARRPAARQRYLPDAEIDGGEVPWAPLRKPREPAERAAARMLHDRSGSVKRNGFAGCSRDQSALAPENFTTFAHFCVSSAMKLPKSADEPVSIMPPSSVSFVFSLGSARPALISLLSLSMTSAGGSFGAPTPYQVLASLPAPASPPLGRSGSASERVAVVTASGRSWPALTYPMEEGMGSKATCSCPPSRSVSIGPAPR